MEGLSTIVWDGGLTTQTKVAELVNHATPFDVDVNETKQVNEWKSLLDSRVAWDPEALTWPRPVTNAAIYGGVVALSISSFALLTGFAVWRNYTVNAELNQNGMRFRLRPPPPPPPPQPPHA